MRPFAVLLLVASVLHTQLAVGCHCLHGTGDLAGHQECQQGCLFEGHGGHGGHDGLGGNESFDSACHHDHSLPAPAPCDGCAECAQSDPVGLRMESSLDLEPGHYVTAWAAPPVVVLSDAQRPSSCSRTSWTVGTRSLLACGTLLRI